MIQDNLMAVTSFYRFFSVAEQGLSSLACSLEQEALSRGIRGLLIVATEGCNGTVSGSQQSIAEYKSILESVAGLTTEDFKDSFTKKHPFRRLRVDIRDEIVTLGKKLEKAPPMNYLTPTQWEAVLNGSEEITLIDVRNSYETELGVFKGAIDPGIPHFSAFPDFVAGANLPRDRKTLIYCTGGIRCEKAYRELVEKGFSDVYQLKGGILRYLEQFPRSFFDGECFVFDHRVALTQELKPSDSFRLCPHCGNPGNRRLNCLECAREAIVCTTCLADKTRQTCSKNCAYHLSRKAANN